MPSGMLGFSRANLLCSTSIEQVPPVTTPAQPFCILSPNIFALQVSSECAPGSLLPAALGRFRTALLQAHRPSCPALWLPHSCPCGIPFLRVPRAACSCRGWWQCPEHCLRLQGSVAGFGEAQSRRTERLEHRARRACC